MNNKNLFKKYSKFFGAQPDSIHLSQKTNVKIKEIEDIPLAFFYF